MEIGGIGKRPISTPKPKRYNSKFKRLMWIHWAMASAVILLYITGICVARLAPAHFLMWLSPFLHQSFGMLFLLLLVARIGTLLQVVSSAYAKRLPKVGYDWVKAASLRASLYFLMLVAPVSGLCLRNFMGADTTFFGIHVAPIFGLNSDAVELARSTHFWISYLLLAAILLHVLAHGKVMRSHWRRIPLFR